MLLFNKHDASVQIEGLDITYDIDNELLIYGDGTSDDSYITLYDLKGSKKYVVNMDSIDDQGIGALGASDYYKIDSVSDRDVFISFLGGILKDKYTMKIVRN